MSKRNAVLAQSELQKSLTEFYFNPETDLSDKMEVAAHLFIEQAIHAMGEMSSKDAMIAAGISIDKMRLLRGLPDEIKASIPVLIQIAERLTENNIQLSVMLTKLLNAMNE